MTESAPTSGYQRRGGRSAGSAKRSRGRGFLGDRPPAMRVAAVALLVTAGLAFSLVALEVAVAAGRIHPGVRVGALDVGGLDVSEATERLSSYVASASAEPVMLVVTDQEWSIDASQVGLSVDATSLAEAAYGVGRGSLADTMGGRLSAWFGRAVVPFALGDDAAAMDSMLGAVSDAVATPPVDASVRVEGADVTLVEAAAGLDIDREDVRRRILDAFLDEGDRRVAAELVSTPPAVSEDGARQAYQDALKMISEPVKLTYEDRSWTISRETIGEWLGFRTAETTAGAPILEAYIASEEVSATLLPLVAEVGRPAKDATFKVGDGKVAIVPSQDGLAADAENVASRLTPLLKSDEERVAELTMQRVSPAITTEMAQQMGISERIATFTTNYSSSNKPRVANIHLLSGALNGTLVAPGAVFSFNETIGPRTAAKGYQEANAIVNGKLVPQFGGGICQVGTTIFNTVFFSGLPVVERRAHSQYLSTYPNGRDATISWGGPDFKFRNDTEHWVLIATAYTNTSVTVSLYGTSPGYKVTYETGPWTSIIDPPVREVKDPDLPVGSKVVDERGSAGRAIVVTRTVTRGGSVVRSDTFKSVYRAVEEVVRVGTKPVASVPATSAP